MSVARDDHEDGHEYGSENALHFGSAPKDEIKFERILSHHIKTKSETHSVIAELDIGFPNQFRSCPLEVKRPFQLAVVR